MLSVLVPLYNFNVVTLIKSLNKQCKFQNIDYEIIVVDDFSTVEYKEKNQILKSIENVDYIELNENIGRSKIRNYLIQKAKYPYLLIMDCDAKIKDEDFIKKYLEKCNGDVVVCGGTAYYDYPPQDENYNLRWIYGIKRESIPAKIRNIDPNKSFSTFNFLISRNIIEKIKFDESFSKYGHEDTLFGFELKRMGCVVQHIDNQLIHLGIDSNDIFIQKTKQGLNNLLLIYKNCDKEIVKDIRLLNLYEKLRKYSFHLIIAFFYRIFSKKIDLRLIKHPSLNLFDFMKLGYLCSLK